MVRKYLDAVLNLYFVMIQQLMDRRNDDRVAEIERLNVDHDVYVLRWSYFA